jgi:hypothetical protein
MMMMKIMMVMAMIMSIAGRSRQCFVAKGRPRATEEFATRGLR